MFTTCVDIREAASLGSPPSIFTKYIAQKVLILWEWSELQETQCPEFVCQMKYLVDKQQNEVIHLLLGRGHYWLCDCVKHLGISIEEWTKMRPEQRQKILTMFVIPTWFLANFALTLLHYNTSLCQFSHWFTFSTSQPNMTKLTMSGMPFGRWRKKNQISEREQTPNQNMSLDTIISSP